MAVDLLSLTTVPDLATRYINILVGAADLTGNDTETSFKTYSNDDVTLWLNGSDMNKAKSKLGLDVTHKVEQFMNENTENDITTLVNKPALSLLGVNPIPIERILCNTAGLFKKTGKNCTYNQKRQTAIMSMFLNSHGFVQGEEITKCVQSFYLKTEEKNIDTNESTRQASNLKDDVTSYEQRLDTMTTEDILSLCAKSRQFLTSNTNAQQISSSSCEEVGHAVSQVVKDPCLNIANLVNEIIVQSIEPEYLEEMFLTTVDSWEELDPEESIDEFLSLISSHIIDILNGRESVLRNELFKLVLPGRFQLPGLENTAVLDIIINTLLGTTMGSVKSIFEIITFANMVDVKSSNEILKIISELEAQIDQKSDEQQALIESESNWTMPGKRGLEIFTNVAKMEWGRHMCFIMFLELVRRLVPALTYTQVGCVSRCVLDQDFVKKDNKDTYVRCIPANTIYYSRGFYFAKWETKGFCSSSYKVLLAKGANIMIH